MNNGIKLAALVCILAYVALRIMVRRVWYQSEHLRPGYFRNAFIVRTADLFAWLFLCATFFLLLNTGRWMYTLLITAGLVGCDVFLHWLFLHLEARRICAHSPNWNMRSAKRRLRQRIERQKSA